MAKNKVKVDVEVTDNGTLKQVGNKAKKAADGLDSAAKGAQNTDRRLKGAAQASSNSTKNFSKMAQGMNSGIVPAYATLAAQIFAVSAAFQFLQNAFDFNNLIKGQEALGSVTGTTYKTITNALVDATAGQLKYADAAKSAAIGTASGLSAGQLTELGTAAKNVSLALGRDLTDSFNRLVRGVTKAEPELLDELGIVLRLDTATRNYAEAIGKPVTALNAFERSQAVANEVLTQAEEKFSKIGDTMSDEALVLNQFLKSFDDLTNTVKVFVAEALTPLFSFLAANTKSLTAALSLFALPIIKSIIPNLDEWKKSSKEAAKANVASYKTQKDALRDLTSVNKAEYEKQKATAKLQSKLGDMSFRKGTAGAKLQAGEAISLRQATGLRSALEGDRGAFKGLDAKTKAKIKRDLDTIVNNSKTSTDKIKRQWKITGDFIGLSMKAGATAGSAAMVGLARASQFAAKAVDKAFKAVSFIGLAFLAIDLAKVAYNWIKNFFNPVTEATQKLQEETDRLLDKYKDLEDELTSSRLVRATTSFGDLKQNVESVGAALQGLDILNFIKDINSFDRSNEKALESFTGIAREASLLNRGFQPLLESLQSGKKLTDDQTAALVNLANAQIQAGLASRSLTRLQTDLSRAVTDLSGNALSTPFDAVIDATKGLRDAQAEALAGMTMYAEGVGSTVEGMEAAANAMGKTQEYTLAEGALQQTEKNLANIKKLAKDYLDIQTQQRKNLVDIADKTTLGITLEERRSDVEASRLTSENKILAARQAVMGPMARVNTLLAEGKKETDSMLIAARNAVRVALENLQVARAQVDVEEYRRLQTEYMITSEERLLDLKRQAFEVTKRNNQAELLAQRNSLGISGTFGFEQARQGQVFETRGLQQDREAELQRIKQLEEALDRNVYKSEAQQLQDAVALETARQKVRALNLQLEARGKIAELTINEVRAENELTQAKLAAISLNPVQQAFNEKMVELKRKGVALSLVDQENLLAEISAQQELMLLLESKQQLFTSITDNISSGLTSIIDGTKSVKQAFADMAVNVLKDIAQMIVKMMVFRALSSFFPTAPAAPNINMSALSAGSGLGGGAAPGFSLPGFRNGGLVGSRMSGYATGGISKGPNAGYPVMMHGTEAVVPLPDGKSIPVSMKGAGQQNNVTVNVSVDSQGNASTNMQQDSAQAGNLGQVIARAVQQELQNQKRSGGILSPYGAT